MSNNVGDIKSVKGTSVQLNSSKNESGMKPEPNKGSPAPGGTKPKKTEDREAPRIR